MQTKSKWLLVLFMSIIGMSLTFYWGWKISQHRTNACYIENYQMVKNLSELGVLEVSGVSKVDLGNAVDPADNSVLNFLKAASLERRMKLEIPFVAKYGVTLTTQQPVIKNNEHDVEVYMPAIVLLSYELHLEKMDAMSRKGLSVFESTADYMEVERLLYKQNRHLLENNPSYHKQSEERIRLLLSQYFSPSEKKVIVYFGVVPTSVTK